MKTNLFPSLVTALAFAGLAVSASAQITSIDATPSGAAISFVDTNSINPSSQGGGTYISMAPNPWGGGTLSLQPTPTVDPLTGDSAQGDLSVTLSSGAYSIALNNVNLDQATPNSGFADLVFQFTNVFQIGSGGLGVTPLGYPDFLVSGTIQSGGFAEITGSIKYFGEATPGPNTLLDSVVYNYVNVTPTTFSGTALGIASSGTTPALEPDSTLEIIGDIDVRVDPADITINSFQNVPEPGTPLLLGAASLGGLMWRRWTRPATSSTVA